MRPRRPVAFTDVTPPSDTFNHPALDFSVSIFLFCYFVLFASMSHGMDSFDNDSDRTANDEHDIHPSDLEELAAVDFFCHGRLVSSIYSSYIQFMG